MFPPQTSLQPQGLGQPQSQLGVPVTQLSQGDGAGQGVQVQGQGLVHAQRVISQPPIAPQPPQHQTQYQIRPAGIPYQQPQAGWNPTFINPDSLPPTQLLALDQQQIPQQPQQQQQQLYDQQQQQPVYTQNYPQQESQSGHYQPVDQNGARVYPNANQDANQFVNLNYNVHVYDQQGQLVQYQVDPRQQPVAYQEARAQYPDSYHQVPQQHPVQYRIDHRQQIAQEAFFPQPIITEVDGRLQILHPIPMQVASASSQGTVVLPNEPREGEAVQESTAPAPSGAGDPLPANTRRRLTALQTKTLEDLFVLDDKPNLVTRANVAETLQLPERSIQVWFQNRRAKRKNEQIKLSRENDRVIRNSLMTSTTLPRQSSTPTNYSPLHGLTSLPHSASGSGSRSGSVSHVTPSPEYPVLNLPYVNHVNGYPQDPHWQQPPYNAEAGPSSAPPTMPPNGQMYAVESMINDGQHQYPHPQQTYGYSTGPGMGEVSLPSRLGRRSSIANGEAANISTLVQKQRGSIGAANAARRGSIPYPPSIHATMLQASSSPQHYQGRRTSGHMVGMGASPLSPQGSASHLAKLTLRNNSRRASMPVNNGMTESTSVGPATKYLIGQSPFQPPRVVSGSPSTSIPANGRVTRELSPIRGLDNGDTTSPTLPQPRMLEGQPRQSEYNFAMIPEYDDTQPTWQHTDNDTGVTYLHYAGPTDVFESYPIGDFVQNGNADGSMLPNGTGPLPNPSFVFGDVHNTVDPMTNNGTANLGLDEAYLAMQHRSRLGSMASIGTLFSEATETSDYNGGYDFLNTPEGYDMYLRRQSAPAGLVDGLGMIGLNPMTASGSGSGSQPIRPSPLGQTHSVSSDHIATTAGNFAGGYNSHNIGLGTPSYHTMEGNGDYDHSQQASGSGSVSVMTTSPTETQPHSYQQNSQDGANANTNQWLNNPNATYLPLSSRHTSASTEAIFTPYDQHQSFPGPNSHLPSQPHTNGTNTSNSNGSGDETGASSGDDYANAATGTDTETDTDAEAAEMEHRLSQIDWQAWAARNPTIPDDINDYARTHGNGHSYSHVNGNAAYTLPGHNGNDFLASLNYADAVGVIDEEDEEDQEEELEKEGVQITYVPDHVDELLLESQ